MTSKKITKEQFDFLDRMGVGQEPLEYLQPWEQQYLRDSIRAMVSIFPFKLVKGMEDMA